MTKFYFSTKSENKLRGVKPRLQDLCHAVIETTPVDFGIVQGLRTPLEQANLYAQGRTKPGPIVTWTQKSKHLSGDAIDFACYLGKDITWSEKFYYEVVDEFKKHSKRLGIPIICGADWKDKPDFGHIELA